MKKYSTFVTQLGESALDLTDKAKLSLYKKSQNSGISTDILEEVYRRGYRCWTEAFGDTPEQFAFERVNSFIAGGFAVELDEDLKKACWKGYEAIGMKMKNGKKVPNCVPVKEDDAEKHSTNPDDPASRFIGSNELVDIYKKETPGQLIKRIVKEAAMQATAAPAPTAADMGPKRLSRYQTTQQTSTMGNQGLNRSGPMGTRISTSSPTTPRGMRSMTSGSTQATAKTLQPQRVSANQPAPKTASAPASAPKPSASFGSSSRPTTVSATSGGMEKSGGYKLSSGMSDAGKAKVKPSAPVEIPAVAGKGVGLLGKLARAATGPAATAVATVMEPQPAGEKKSEFQRQADVAKGVNYKPQGRSVKDYEAQVLTPKTYDKPVSPKVDVPTPPSRPEHFSFGSAFKSSREKAGGPGGSFEYTKGSGDTGTYHTGYKGETVPKKLTPVESESGKKK